MDTDDTWTFPYPGNSHAKPSRIRTKQFLFYQNDLWFPQHVTISDVKPTASLLTTRKTLSSSCHTWQQTDRKAHLIFFSDTSHNILTCYSFCIYNICCCFCHSCVKNIIAHCIHSSRIQRSLLLAGAKGLDAQIHLCTRKTQRTTLCWTQDTLHPRGKPS